ncbi:MAG: spore coat protein, partial [Verrucomicrobiota bacterium]
MIARFALRKGGSFLCLALCAAFCLCLRATAADPADELFTNRAIRHLSIEIGASQMKILRAPVTRNRNAGQRPSVPAMVHEGDLTWTNVAVHLKGSLGSFRTVNDKPALTLNFNKGSGNERFHGLQKISLNNSVQDLSFVSEKICRELYAAAGVPVPRVDYATVELNGRNLGLFVLAEGWNKQFLGRYFKNVKGNFYDLGGGHDVDKPMDAAFGENPTNHSALEAVAAAANLSDPTQRLKRLRATLDLDRFLSLHALDILMWNWDGYAMGKNNYRMFHDLDAGRLVFLPHGVDQMFWKANGPIMTGRSGLV